MTKIPESSEILQTLTCSDESGNSCFTAAELHCPTYREKAINARQRRKRKDVLIKATKVLRLRVCRAHSTALRAGSDPLGSPLGWGRWQHCSTGCCCCCCGDWRWWRLTDREMQRAARTPPTQHHQLSQEQMLGRNYFHLLSLKYHVRQGHSSQRQKNQKHRWVELEGNIPTHISRAIFSFPLKNIQDIKRLYQVFLIQQCYCVFSFSHSYNSRLGVKRVFTPFSIKPRSYIKCKLLNLSSIEEELPLNFCQRGNMSACSQQLSLLSGKAADSEIMSYQKL